MSVTVLPDYRFAALASARGEDVISPRRLRLTIEDIEALDAIWSQDDRYHSTELIDGQAYHTPARCIPRGKVVTDLFVGLREAAEAIGLEYWVGIRGSIAMPPFDLPLPDVLLTSEPKGPGFIPAASVPLVVEVSESALDFFLGEKLRLYARNGIPEYWVADVNGRVIHQLWAPAGEAYAERREVAFGEMVEAVTIAGLRVETRGLTS